MAAQTINIDTLCDSFNGSKFYHSKTVKDMELLGESSWMKPLIMTITIQFTLDVILNSLLLSFCI